MLSISKEDAEFLAGFIDQWLPVCGEKTAERARAVRECLTSAASINQERGKFDREPWEKFLPAHSIKTIPISIEGTFSAGGGGCGYPVVGRVPGIDNAISVGYMVDHIDLRHGDMTDEPDSNSHPGHVLLYSRVCNGKSKGKTG